MYNLREKYKQIPVEVKVSFWFLICSFLQRGISVITIPIFTRLLSTQEYGQYSVFLSWMDIVTIFVSLKLYAGVFLQGYVKQTNKYKFSSAMQGLSLTLLLCWSLVYYIFRSFFNNLFSLNTVQMIAMLSMIWTTAVFSYWSIEQRMVNNYKALIIITLLVSLAKPISGIILIFTCEDKVTARIIGLAVIEMAVYFGMFVKDMQKGKCFFDKQIWKYALSFNIPLIPHYLSIAVLNSSDRIMIEYYEGESKVGIYNLAYSLASIMTLFNSSLLQSVEPWLYKKINSKRVQDISKVAYTTLILIASVNIALIAVVPEAVKIFAPPEYAEAIWIIPSVAMSVFFMYSYSLFAAFEFYYEKNNYIITATLIGAVLNVILNYLFIPKFGYIAAGYTTLVCYMLFAIMHYVFMARICKDELSEKVFNTKIILGIVVMFLIIGIVFLVSYENVILRYSFISIIVFILVCSKKLVKSLLRILTIKMDR